MTSKYFIAAFFLVFVFQYYGIHGAAESDPPCVDLTGFLTFLDEESNGIAVIQTRYVTTSLGINFTGSGIQIAEDRIFEFGLNGYFACEGNATTLCKFLYANPSADGEFLVDIYSYYSSGYPWAAALYVQKIIRKNGYLMKNETQAFTPDDPCTSYMPKDNYYGTPLIVTLCCTRFNQPPSSPKLTVDKPAVQRTKLPPRRRPKFAKKTKPNMIIK